MSSTLFDGLLDGLLGVGARECAVPAPRKRANVLHFKKQRRCLNTIHVPAILREIEGKFGDNQLDPPLAVTLRLLDNAAQHDMHTR